MKKIAILFIGALFLLYSCEETQSPIYDGSQTLAYFDGSSSTLEVQINDTNTIDISVGVSTISSSPRTVTVSVDEAGTTATPGMYDFSSTVTIPANEFFGTLTVTGIDDGLTTTGEALTLKIDSVDGGVGSSGVHTINLLEVCPTPSEYMIGQYILNDTSGLNFATETVTIVATGENSRRFEATWFPAYSFATSVDVDINLICNQFTMEDIDDINVGCNGGVSFIILTTPPNPADRSSYDLASDAVLSINYLSDPEGSCGTSLETLTLTKI